MQEGAAPPTHPTLAPTTASLSPCRRRRRGRAGRRKRCSCCRHRCPAPRWSRSRTGSGPPRCSRPRSPLCQGADREAGTGTRCRGAGGWGAALSPGRAPPLHGHSVPAPPPVSAPPPARSSRLRPQERPAPFPTPSQGCFPTVGSSIFASLLAQPAGVFQSPAPQRAPLPCPSLGRVPPSMLSSSQSSRSLRALPSQLFPPAPGSAHSSLNTLPLCPFHPALPFAQASDPARETFPPGPALLRPCSSTATS